MGASLSLFRGHAPERPECRVGEANAPIRTEHGDTFGQMVDGFALHLHQRVVAHLQVDLLGQVLENPGRAALRMGGCNNPQGLAVRQVPEIGLGIQRTVDGKRRLFPVLPIQLLRQFAGGAQPVQKLGIIRAGFEENEVETPESRESLIVELQPLPAVENGDGRCQMIERFSVTFQNPLEFLADGFGFRCVDSDASRTAGCLDIHDVKEGAVSGNNRRNTVVIG
ncbi:hypothetical protein D3C86_1203650 [compost metagenome]